jgi:hypothetical protein
MGMGMGIVVFLKRAHSPPFISNSISILSFFFNKNKITYRKTPLLVPGRPFLNCELNKLGKLCNQKQNIF